MYSIRAYNYTSKYLPTIANRLVVLIREFYLYHKIWGVEQGKELTDYFKSNPTAQNIRIEARDVVEFPEITFCPGMPWNYTALELQGILRARFTYLLGGGNLTKSLNMSSLSEVVNFFTVKDLPHMVYSCSIKTKPGDLGCMPGDGLTLINGSHIHQLPSKFGKLSFTSQQKT